MWIDNSGHHIVTLLEPLFINAESFQHCNNFQLFSDYTIHEFSLWVGLEPPSYSYKPCLLKLWTNLSSQEAAPCIMFSWRVCLFPRSKSPLSTWNCSSPGRSCGCSNDLPTKSRSQPWQMGGVVWNQPKIKDGNMVWDVVSYSGICRYLLGNYRIYSTWIYWFTVTFYG